VATLSSAPTSGEPGVAIRVEFDAPAGCSNADAFYSGLLARMRSARRAAPGEDGVHLRVRLTRIGGKVRGELRLVDAPGEGDTRRVDGETCDSVVEVLSLTAALALTGQPAAQPPPPPPPPPPRPAPPRAPPSSPATSNSTSTSPSNDTPAKPPEPTPPVETPKPPEPPKPPAPEPPPGLAGSPPEPPAQKRRTQIGIGLHALAADLISSSYSFGGALAVRLERRADDGAGASIGLSALYVPDGILQTADSIAIRWTAIAATGCPGWNLGKVMTVQPCVQVIGGWLAARGRDLTHTLSPSRSWWSAGGLLRFGAALGAGFSLQLDTGLTVPLVERTFVTTTPEETVGETPTVSPLVTLGLSVSL
jgi:hypothetical protein